jgi:hypothetical protein
MNMDIPAELKKLQKKAQEHAIASLKRQMRQLKGENPSDESSPEEGGIEFGIIGGGIFWTGCSPGGGGGGASRGAKSRNV